MRNVVHAESLKKVFYFLLPAILTLILVLSIVAMARATETGSVKEGLAGDGMKNETSVAAPAGETTLGAAQGGVQQEEVKQEMPGTDQSGLQAGQGATAEPEKAAPDAANK